MVSFVRLTFAFAWAVETVLSKRSKLIFAGSLGLVGLAGLMASDALEDAIPAAAPPSQGAPHAGSQGV
jgi:hypothetical protein